MSIKRYKKTKIYKKRQIKIRYFLMNFLILFTKTKMEDIELKKIVKNLSGLLFFFLIVAIWIIYNYNRDITVMQTSSRGAQQFKNRLGSKTCRKS